MLYVNYMSIAPHTFVSAQTIEKGLWIGNGLPSWPVWQPERPAPAQNGVATSGQSDSVGAEHLGKDTHTTPGWPVLTLATQAPN